MGDKRDAILQSALDILVEKGINFIRIAEVARRADIGKGTVYEYFKSKDDLISGAIEMGLGLCVDHISTEVEGNGSFQNRYDAFCDAVLDITEKGPFLSMVSSSPGIALSPSALKKINAALEKTMNPIYSIFEDIMQKGVAEGALNKPGDELHIRSMLTIITNTAFYNMKKNTYDRKELKHFFRAMCVKIFS